MSYHDNDRHQDDARLIPTGNYGKPSPAKQLPLSWKEAAWLFFQDNKKSLLTKVVARYAPAVLGFIGVADDFAIPVLGIADEPLTIGFIALCVWRINKYRRTGK